MDNKAQVEEDPESFKLGLGGRDAGGQGRERGPPDVSPRGLGVGSREETLRVVGRAAASGRLLREVRPGERGERRRVPIAQVGRDPDPALGPSRYLPAGKLRTLPGLSRPPASGARKRPHIAGERAGGLGTPDSPR